MSYVVWISILTLITKVCCQCSGGTTSLSVGYTTSTVQSPNYDNGYSQNLRCSWRHSTTVAGAALLVQINGTVACSGDGLTIYDGTDSTGSILHSCTDTTPSYFVALTGSIYTSFTTDAVSGSGEKGFAYNVISARDYCGTACTSLVTLMASTTVQYISSPNFPDVYPGNGNCFWRIEKKASEKLELSFKFIDIEWIKSCSFDHIKITDDETGTTVLKTCGENQWFPTQTYTTTGNLTIEFYCDVSNHRRGFLLAYSVLSSSESSSDESSCFYDNCVILPVSIAVGGVVVIIIIATIILCVATKAFAKNSTRPLADSRVQTIQSLIFPKSRTNVRSTNSSKDIFGPKSHHIISQPPIATQTIFNTSPRSQRATGRLQENIPRSTFSVVDESKTKVKKNILDRTNKNMMESFEDEE